MKAKIRLILLISCISFGAFNTSAQKHKIGYLNVPELWSLMPEKVEADSIVNALTLEYNNYYSSNVQEYNQKLAAFVADSTADKSDLLYQSREKDLIKMKEELELFRTQAEERIQAKKKALYEPIRIKMQAAVDKVAEKNGYDYILDSAFGNIIYTKGEDNDIMDLVKVELGLS